LCGQHVELGLDGQRAAAHVQAVVAIANGLVKCGELFNMVDECLRGGADEGGVVHDFLFVME
jgi:hypothetical protein